MHVQKDGFLGTVPYKEICTGECWAFPGGDLFYLKVTEGKDVLLETGELLPGEYDTVKVVRVGAHIVLEK